MAGNKERTNLDYLDSMHAAAKQPVLRHTPGSLKDFVITPDEDFGFSVQRLHWMDGRDTNSENICPAIVEIYNSYPAMGKELREAKELLSELVDLFEDTMCGDYEPDSFTTQPARRFLYGDKSGNG